MATKDMREQSVCPSVSALGEEEEESCSSPAPTPQRVSPLYVPLNSDL